MEIAILILVCLSILIGLVNLFCLLMIATVVVQVMEVLGKLPDELRAPKREKREGERPWYTYL